MNAGQMERISHKMCETVQLYSTKTEFKIAFICFSFFSLLFSNYPKFNSMYFYLILNHTHLFWCSLINEVFELN